MSVPAQVALGRVERLDLADSPKCHQAGSLQGLVLGMVGGLVIVAEEDAKCIC